MEWFLILPLYLCSIVLLGCMAVLLIIIVIQVFRIFRGSEAVKQLSKKSLLRSTLFFVVLLAAYGLCVLAYSSFYIDF